MDLGPEEIVVLTTSLFILSACALTLYWLVRLAIGHGTRDGR